MAWHILHASLEQVRINSTFPGKLWILMTLIFRVVVVARIGDMVYHDEQGQFICNTLTPGCKNVCFNRFSPISQLRFWSLMVLTVATPSILFFIYASHKIYHASVKFPLDDGEDHENGKSHGSPASSEPAPPYRPPSIKRKRTDSYPFTNATAPLFVVRRLGSKNTEKSKDEKTSEKNSKSVRNRKHAGNRYDYENIYPPLQNSYPIYADSRGRKVEYIESTKPIDPVRERKERRRMLENPQLYRAYWWHVVFRTIFEVGFVLGQIYLYGFFVPELFECTILPCVKTVDCYVSRPMEKTCLAFLMLGLGGISCILSIGEFWTLGWDRFMYAVCCRGHKMTYEEKRRQLAKLSKDHHKHDEAKTYLKPHHDEIKMLHHHGDYGSALSLESDSSETTIESV